MNLKLNAEVISDMLTGDFDFLNYMKYKKVLSNVCTKPNGEIYLRLTLLRNQLCLTIESKQVLSIFKPVRKFLKATISFVMSVLPSVRLSSWNNSAPTGLIFRKIGV